MELSEIRIARLSLMLVVMMRLLRMKRRRKVEPLKWIYDDHGELALSISQLSQCLRNLIRW